MRIRFYRDGRGQACVEADAGYEDLKDFLTAEVRRHECVQLLELVHAAAGDARLDDIWNVHSFKISGEGVRIENDVLPGNASLLTLGDFAWVLSEWRDFLDGRSEPGWRLSS